MKKIIAMTNLQLKNASPKDVVKIAGITRRLKNWIRGKVDPAYLESVNLIREETSIGKNLLKQMYIDLENIQKAITDGDVNDYESNFLHFKNLIQEFINTTKNIKEKASDYYLKEDMSESSFNKKVEESLPKEYGISINTEYHKPLKSFEWYKNLESSLISINDKGALIKLFIAIEKKIIQENLATQEEIKKILSDNKDIIILNFKNSIVNGNLIKAVPSEPGTAKRVPYGRMNLFVTTEPFVIPGINKKAQCIVKLMDLTVGKKPVQKISFIATTHLNFIGEKISTSKFINLIKNSEQIPYKINQLSDLQLAKVLMEGYKKAFGREPTAQILAGGWAQVILEAGRPVKLPNNNIGNIKAENAWIKSGKPYFSKETGEFTSSGKFFKTPATWKAFATPADGAEYYWKYLQRKHPQSLQWMAAEDPVSATVTLGLNGYFTANIKKYAKGVEGLYFEFMKKIAPQLDLKNQAIKINKTKPIIKEWKDLYSKEEMQNILKNNVENLPANNQVDILIKDLVASGPLSNLTKNAIIKNSIPLTMAMTQITGKNSIYIGNKLSYFLTKYLNSAVTIHKENDVVEIQSHTKGSPIKVVAAIQAIADKINKNNDFKIISAPNVKSILPRLNEI